MNTFEGKSCKIHFNSDMSGDIVIHDTSETATVIIEGQDILNFVASYIRNEKISKLENMSTNELLDLCVDKEIKK